MPPVIERSPFLTPEECSEVKTAVYALKDRWISRHDDLPLATLGPAAYIDAAQFGPMAYGIRAKKNNPMLETHFGWLYERLAETVSAVLGAPAVCTMRFAKPGFHVWRYHAALASMSASVHFDLQHQMLRFPVEDSRVPENRMSFTVPVAMPEAGAGLYVWDLLHDPDVHTRAPKESEIEDVPRAYHAYALGELMMHDGSHLHQIASDRPMKPGDERITFQGHGVFTGGTWQLYW